MKNLLFFDNSPQPTTDAVDPSYATTDPQEPAAQSQWHPPLLPPSGTQSAPPQAGVLPPGLATLLGVSQSLGQSTQREQAPQQMQSSGASPQFAPSRVSPPTTMPDFLRAITTVIDTHEGGFQDRDDDPGNFTPSGEKKGTKYGISAAVYPDKDIKNLTKEQAADLFQRDYGMFTALADQRVLTKVLDLAVNMQMGGKGPATRILQQAINASGGNVRVDGVFGVRTADAANTIPPDVLLKAIVDQSMAQYAEIEKAKPHMKAWFKGWEDRAQWLPQKNMSRAQSSNSSSAWNADKTISERERADAIRSIRLGLAGLSDQPAPTASHANAAPPRKTASQPKNASQAKAAAVKQAQNQQRKK